MKKEFAILVLFLSFLSTEMYSQSSLESEFFKQLNLYRKKNGLSPVKYDEDVSVVAAYHAKYLVECKKIRHAVHYDRLPHDEQFDIKGFEEKNFEERVAMAPDKNIWGEVQIQCLPVSLKGNSNKEIAEEIIDSFDGSPKHKEILVCEDNPNFTNIVGISIIKTQSGVPDYEEYVVNVNFGIAIP